MAASVVHVPPAFAEQSESARQPLHTQFFPAMVHVQPAKSGLLVTAAEQLSGVLSALVGGELDETGEVDETGETDPVGATTTGGSAAS